MDNTGLKEKVKEANRQLYDHVADNYESIDGRRSDKLSRWVKERLNECAGHARGRDVFVDIGCGSGFVIKEAKGIFTRGYGVDISRAILKQAAPHCDGVVCCDSEHLPFKDNSVDAVVLFAAIHHFFDYDRIIAEAHRVLKKGGVIYMDHDINLAFVKRYRTLLKIYRKIVKRKKKYLDVGVSKETYDLSEVHSEGVDLDQIARLLESLGFEIIVARHHWYGLNDVFDALFGYCSFRRGNAPLTSMMARKR